MRNPVSWMGSPRSETRLLDWIPGWLEHYEVVGLAEMLSADRTDDVWGEAAHSAPDLAVHPHPAAQGNVEDRRRV